MKRSAMLVALTSAVLAVCSAATAGSNTVSIDLSNVADPGNAASGVGFGSVNDVYAIGTGEVTNAQYAAFLTAVAKKDPKGLYTSKMSGKQGGITRIGKNGSYSYTAKAGWENLPVNFVSYYDSLRFVNWLNNGQIVGPEGNTTTERGAYNMSLSKPVKDANAKYWLPSENEWFKAAYYKGGNLNAGYWNYATQSNFAPTIEAPPGGTNSANYTDDIMAIGAPKYLNASGAYTNTKSAYGAYDMNGNVWEWTDTVYVQGKSKSANKRVYRGGAYDSVATQLQNLYRAGADKSGYTAANLGFRVAGLYIEDPLSTYTLTLKKFNDANDNGTQDAGEGWLEGWGFHVTGPSSTDQTLYTGADGTVTLSSLVPGSYSIVEIPSTGFWKAPHSPGSPIYLNADMEWVSGSQPIPEPATLLLLTLGGAGLLRRKRKQI